MAVDKDGKVVLFGGQGPSAPDPYGNYRDTWLWDGSTWTQATPTVSPPARVNFSMATDTNGNVVLFGGTGGPGPTFADTWLWNGSNWSQATPNVSPPGRVGQAMATDHDGNVVLFGGAGNTGFVADTWVWDGSNWTQSSGTPSPSARVNAGMASDGKGTLVLFGGCCPPLGDTWLFGATKDTIPPELVVPSDQTVPATGPDGALVTFTVTATDAVDGPVTATCAPPSGSTFAIGTTSVACTAEDKSGNTASKSFVVRVTGAVEQLARLGEAVAASAPARASATRSTPQRLPSGETTWPEPARC